MALHSALLVELARRNCSLNYRVCLHIFQSNIWALLFSSQPDRLQSPTLSEVSLSNNGAEL